MVESNSTDRESGPMAPPPLDVTIVQWPLRDSTPIALLILSVTIAATIITTYGSNSLLLVVLVQTVQMVGLWRIWIPVTYHLTNAGVIERVFSRQRFMDWLSITHVRVLKNGVFLVSNPRNVPILNIFGTFIRWDDKREQIMALVQYFVLDRLLLSDNSTEPVQPSGN